MRLSTLAVIGGLVAFSCAEAIPQAQCEPETVTVTVTAGGLSGAGATPASEPPAPEATPPPSQQHGYGQEEKQAQGPLSSYVTTGAGTVTSVEYNMRRTSTYCPSAGIFKNPYPGGDSVTCGHATWTTMEYPRSTVYNYPEEGMNKVATKAIYENKKIVHIVMVGINVQVYNGETTSSYMMKNDRPTYTPPPPPPYTPTTSAPGSAKTHYVDVGTFDGKVQFIPDEVEAVVGDIMMFNFLAKSHSVTQSDFGTPCTFNGGFDTGLNQPNPNNETDLFLIPFTVSTADPLWFYCKQPGPPNHCGKGMVFGINPAGKMDQFIQNAIKQNSAKDGAASTPGPSSTATSSATGTSETSNSIPTVIVGGDSALKFDPPFLEYVKRGQQIHFDFRALNHTFTESSFDEPCAKLPGTTVDTNFMNANKEDVADAHPFDLWINSDIPRYFYCKQANGTPKSHCGKGMVFAINVNQQRFDDFVKNAKATLPERMSGSQSI